MFQYFKSLEQLAHLNNDQYSICDLTKNIMMDAGYQKYDYTFKNGHIRQRVRYTKEFNQILVAKWLCFYKDLYISKLIKIPKLMEYQVDIINKTFYSVFSCLDIDKLVDNNIVNKYFNLSLNSRIGEYLYIYGSSKRREKLNTDKKLPMRLKTSINHLAESLDQLQNYNVCFNDLNDIDCNSSDFLVDLSRELSNNIFGKRLLEAMLFSNKKINLKRIDDYIYLDDSEKTYENKLIILDAYNIIYQYLCNLYGREFKKFTIHNIDFATKG